MKFLLFHGEAINAAAIESLSMVCREIVTKEGHHPFLWSLKVSLSSHSELLPCFRSATTDPVESSAVQFLHFVLHRLTDFGEPEEPRDMIGLSTLIDSLVMEEEMDLMPAAGGER